MSIATTYLDIDIINSGSCRKLIIADSSYYNPSMTISEPTIKILVPGFDTAVTLNFIPNTTAVFNSNNLGVTHGYTPSTYVNLPDGFYTIQYSVCPHDNFYIEKSYFRTCLIDCKYRKAVLKLNLGNCDSPCISKENKDLLDCVRFYIEGAKANADDCNIKKASQLYNKADDLLNLFLNCDDCNSSPCLPCGQ